jgi:hypothetical protein
MFNARAGSGKSSSTGNIDAMDVIAFGDGYQFAAAKVRPNLSFQELEAIIRRDPTAKSHRSRIEFGSVKME